MHPTHEMMEVLTPGWHPQVLIKLVHQPGFATPDRAPEVNAHDRLPSLMQSFVALLQGPHGMFLGFVLDEALLFDGVLPGAEWRVDIHARQYASGFSEMSVSRLFFSEGKSVLTLDIIRIIFNTCCQTFKQRLQESSHALQSFWP
jgi:hypothetical protein